MFKSRAIPNRFLHLQKNVAKYFSTLFWGGCSLPNPTPPLPRFRRACCLPLVTCHRVNENSKIIFTSDMFWNKHVSISINAAFVMSGFILLVWIWFYIIKHQLNNSWRNNGIFIYGLACMFIILIPIERAVLSVRVIRLMLVICR